MTQHHGTMVLPTAVTSSRTSNGTNNSSHRRPQAQDEQRRPAMPASRRASASSFSSWRSAVATTATSTSTSMRKRRREPGSAADVPSVPYRTEDHLSVLFQMYGSVWHRVLPLCLANVMLSFVVGYLDYSRVLNFRLSFSDKGHR